MTYVALLRAVNVGGTSKLPMAELTRIAGELGLENARTFIASGNLLFTSSKSEAELTGQLEAALEKHMAKRVPVMIRTAAEMEAVAKANPFSDAPGRRVMVTFLSDAPPADAIEQARFVDGERLALGKREIYVDYCGRLLGRARLKVPAAEKGTGRNMNTVATLAELSRELS